MKCHWFGAISRKVHPFVSVSFLYSLLVIDCLLGFKKDRVFGIFVNFVFVDSGYKTAVVWAVSLAREVRVVVVDYLDSDKRRQTRKVFFSTDTSMSARDIFDIYRTRFQLEFVFRDAKQFTGLTHCQARNKEALSFAFNASLTSVNLARAFARQQGMNISVGSTKTLLHNAAMVDRFIAMSGKSPNMRLNNTDFNELLFYGVRAAG